MYLEGQKKGGGRVDDENRLVNLVKTKKDRKAADRLVSKYYDDVYSYIYCQLGNVDDAMDLTHEAFLSFLQNIGKYDPEKSGLRTWLHSIATNKVIDFRRKNKTICIDIEDIELPDGMDYLKQIEDKEMLSEIDEFVRNTDEESEKIFRMRLYRNLSFADIGAALGISEGNSRLKYHRIIEKIRKEFGNER